VSFALSIQMESQLYMRKHQLLLTGGVALCAALVLGQTLPATLPSRPSGFTALAPQLEAWSFVLQGKGYGATLSRAQVSASPEWSPSALLPLTPAKAEAIARGELRKLVSDDSTWVVEEFMLRRFRGEAQGKWIYVVGFKPADGTTNATSDRFFLPISFSGEPAKITTR
jgi:hypothetical protein